MTAPVAFDFPCPFCDGTVSTQTGPASSLAHTLPVCESFVSIEDPTRFLEAARRAMARKKN